MAIHVPMKMEVFDGNETNVVWPAWRLDLNHSITFEFGAVGVDIVDGKIAEDIIDAGDDVTSRLHRLPGH